MVLLAPKTASIARFSGASRVFVIAVLAGIGLPAHAAPGDHITAGPFTITPSLTAGFDYSTNPRHESVTPQPGGSLLIRPAVTASATSATTTVDIGAEYDLRKYFQQNLLSLDRYDNFAVTGNVVAGKTSMVGFHVNEGVAQRSFAVDSPSPIAYQGSLRQMLKAGPDFRPSSGIEILPEGRLGFENYLLPGNAGDGSRQFNSKTIYGGKLSVLWKFFPRTALVLSSTYERHNWRFQEVDVPDGTLIGDNFVKPDSDQFDVMIGMRGKITTRLQVSTGIGYGGAWYKTAELPDAVDADVRNGRHLVLEVEGQYKLNERGDKISFGYERRTADVFFTNYVGYDSFFVRGDQRFSERFGGGLGVNLRFEGYRGVVERNDAVVDLSGNVRYFLQDWAWIQANGAFVHRSTNADALYDPGYDEVVGGVSATFQY